MPRNDSILLTGMSSASVNKLERVQEKERLRKEAKIKAKRIIEPAIEPVLEELDKEIANTILAQMDLIDSDTQNFEAVALSLRMYKESCKRLRSRLSNIMRVKPDGK